jgi:hypothetical protein
MYGLLNFPFMIFLLKPCVLFLSKSRETGYDSEGNCVPKYLADDMYKLRFGKKRIIINSKGIELKVEDTVESGVAAKDTDNSTKKLESVMDQVEEIKPR